MISYLFPPDGSAGVYRPLRFVRQLRAMGWSPSVVSADLEPNGWYRFDPELLTLVPDDTPIVRVRNGDLWQRVQLMRRAQIQEGLKNTGGTAGQTQYPNRSPVRSFLREVVQHAEAWCYHPDTAMCWIRAAVNATVKLCAQVHPRAIWATAGPVSSLIVAKRASERTGVPYVLDFRDPWTITRTEFEARRPQWATDRDRRTMYELLDGAQAVIFRYDTEAECYWRAYAGAVDARKVHIIPNGFEGPISEFVEPDGNRCTILYTGTVLSYRYDTLLHALCDLKKSDPQRARQLRLLFVGEGMEELAGTAATHDLGDIVETIGTVSRAQSLNLQQEAHALLILGRLPAIRGYELLAGAKLYEYLKAGRPIVGIVPADETRKTLCRVGVSTIADADSPASIVDVLRRLLDAWSNRTLSSLVPNRSACEAFSADRQTAAVVRALEGVPATDPFIPGSVEIPPSLREEIGNGEWIRLKS